MATTPLPLLFGSITLTFGGDLYPNPPAVTTMSKIPPSLPIIGTAAAPTPPDPEITTIGPPVPTVPIPVGAGPSPVGISSPPPSSPFPPPVVS